MESPVALPPGRDRLATNPLPSGSTATGKTIGIDDVACFAAATALPPATMMSTSRFTNAWAIAGACSLRPSVQRYSMVMVRPLIQPSSPSRCSNAAICSRHAVGDVVPRKPMTGTFCCARADRGQGATAPPRSVMKSRRLMCIPSAEDHTLTHGPRGCRIGALRQFGTLRQVAASAHSDLSTFQNTGVAGPSSTPDSDFRQDAATRYCPTGM